MAYDPTKTALLLATLLARADARQFTFTQVVTTTTKRGTHPSQGVFPTTTNETHYALSWTANYRGQSLKSTILVVPAPLLPLGVAASLQEASDAFDLTDTRLERLGANPNTLGVGLSRGADQYQSQVIRIDSVTPNNGSDQGGTVVTIKGAGFARAVQVLFGKQAVIPTVLHDGTLQATAPSTLVDGLVDVTVTSVYGAQYNGVLKNAFRR